MTRIARVLAVPATGAGYAEDLAALQAQPLPLGERLTAPALTPGFRAVREVAEAVSIGLVLDSGQVAWGDCVAVSYGGLAGRDPVFRTRHGLAAVQRLVAPALEGRELSSFRELAALVDGLGVSRVAAASETPATAGSDVADSSRRALLSAPFRALRAASRSEPDPGAEEGVLPGDRLHTAVRYGASQALLAAVALDRATTMAEVIAREWGLPLPRQPVPLHAQCGHERQHNAEKMIVRRIASLPHALVDDLAVQVGLDGGELTRYIRWLRDRIAVLGGEDYCPTIHLDLYGALGQIGDGQPGRMLGQIYGWRTAAEPYRLRLECPVLLGSREAQMEAMITLKDYVRMRGLDVQLVADEWANSLEDIKAFVRAGAADLIQVKMPDLGSVHNAVDALLACKGGGVGAFLGGSYAETDLSARVAVHVALAAQADLLMARPGMGVDEAISLAENEMARTLATVGSSHPGSQGP
jgi:methylaspartate ammonia-lyase